jgi:hypothetical protein
VKLVVALVLLFGVFVAVGCGGPPTSDEDGVKALVK